MSETGFVPQTFGFKDHCLIHYSTGPTMKPEKSIEVKIIRLNVTTYIVDKKVHAGVNKG